MSLELKNWLAEVTSVKSINHARFSGCYKIMFRFRVPLHRFNIFADFAVKLVA